MSDINRLFESHPFWKDQGWFDSTPVPVAVVAPPVFEVTGCTPNSGPLAGGTHVTITGNLLISGGGGTSSVQFGSPTDGWLNATNVVFVNETTITCNTSAGWGLGPADIRVMAMTDEVVGTGLFTFT